MNLQSCASFPTSSYSAPIQDSMDNNVRHLRLLVMNLQKQNKQLGEDVFFANKRAEEEKKKRMKVEEKVDQMIIKVNQMKRLISPPVKSRGEFHRIAVVKLSPNLYKLIRSQQRNLYKRLREIKTRHKIVLGEPGVLKIWYEPPHSVDSGISIKHFLRKNLVKMVNQEIHWDKPWEKLHELVEAFLHEAAGGERRAARTLGNTHITDYYPSVVDKQAMIRFTDE